MSATAKTAEPKMAARAKIDTAKPTAFLAAGGAADGSTAPDPAREALGVACGPPTASTITIVDAIGPPFVGKTFALVNGKLVKTKVVASIWDGKARMVEVPTAEAMAAILEQVTQSGNQALVLDAFKNGRVGEQFRIVTEDKLAHLLGNVPVGDEGVYNVEGTPIAARLKRGVSPSMWVLLDADNPEGMPAMWTALSLEQRLKMLEPILPGVSACERIEYLSSSARVVKQGSNGGPPFATHAMVRVTDPERVDTLREYLKVATVIEGLSFKSPRYSRTQPGKVIGHEQRTLIDLSVMVAGRIVFEAKPDVSKAPGYQAITACARIVNPGGGALDIGAINLPDAPAVAKYKQKTGLSVSFSSARGNLSVTVRNVLREDTEIESRGVVKPLSEWLAGMGVGEKLRCEAPFRASQSEAAFVRKDGENAAILYDAGTSTSYPLTGTFPDDADTPDLPEDDDAFDEMDEALLASRMPAIDPKAFYGPLKEIVETATEHSEATKVGVALQIIAQVALCLRPFFIPMDEKPLYLNVYLLQIGMSAKGRKGTSSAFADNFVAPAIRALAEEMRRAHSLAEYDRQTKEDAREAVREAECDVERALLLGDADAAKAAALVAKLKSERTETETAVAIWKKRLAAKAYSPASQKNYERSIKDGEARIVELGPRILDAEAEHARILAVLADRAAALAVADTALAQAKANEATIPEPQAPQPWLELFMALEMPPASMRGVSSGEGVIHEIRDARPPNGTRDDKGDPGVREKRLFINLSEFGVVLAQIRRTGSTLSTTLRDAYDCVPLMTGSKNSPSRVEKPYLCLSASITPAEFMRQTFDEHDATATSDNGLANRIMGVFVAREKLVPCPEPARERERLSRGIAENILKLYRELKPAEAFASAAVEFTPEAKALYQDGIYARIDGLSGASDKAGKLLLRATTNLRKLAAILAAINGERQVSIGALEAAVAWIDYSAASANIIAATMADRRRHARLKEDATALLAALRALGGDCSPVSSREVRRKTHFDDKRFQEAVRFIVNRPPSPVEIVEEDWTSGNGTVRKRSLLVLRQPQQQRQQQQEEPFQQPLGSPSPMSFPSEEETL